MDNLPICWVILYGDVVPTSDHEKALELQSSFFDGKIKVMAIPGSTITTAQLAAFVSVYRDLQKDSEIKAADTCTPRKAKALADEHVREARERLMATQDGFKEISAAMDVFRKKIPVIARELENRVKATSAKHVKLSD